MGGSNVSGGDGVFLRRVGCRRGGTTELVLVVLYLVGDIEIDATWYWYCRRNKSESSSETGNDCW